MYKVFETERLRVRPINLQDASFILTLVNSEGWLKYIGDRNIKDIGDSEQYIQKILNNSKYFYNVFELKNSGIQIGIVTFLYRDDYQYPDIGFALLPEYEKNGYSFEASRTYLDNIFKNNLADKVLGITVPKNYSSIKLLQKLGLTFKETIVKDKEQLSIFEITNENKYASR
ncbi:MAG: GNAT family N-acetyltransferase [Bacteroidetes bacterium]|nr:MAG: GNAT family N-acetyltransferase [Bacteroidota bacterium]